MKKKTHKHGPKGYRRLADQYREAALTVSAEKERADLLARAKIWDFLADHCPRHPALNE